MTYCAKLLLLFLTAASLLGCEGDAFDLVADDLITEEVSPIYGEWKLVSYRSSNMVFEYTVNDKVKHLHQMFEADAIDYTVFFDSDEKVNSHGGFDLVVAINWGQQMTTDTYKITDSNDDTGLFDGEYDLQEDAQIIVWNDLTSILHEAEIKKLTPDEAILVIDLSKSTLPTGVGLEKIDIDEYTLTGTAKMVLRRDI